MEGVGEPFLLLRFILDRADLGEWGREEGALIGNGRSGVGMGNPRGLSLTMFGVPAPSVAFKDCFGDIWSDEDDFGLVPVVCVLGEVERTLGLVFPDCSFVYESKRRESCEILGLISGSNSAVTE